MLAEEAEGVSGFARALEFAAQTLLLHRIRYFGGRGIRKFGVSTVLRLSNPSVLTNINTGFHV